jgi:hypothetical protein
VGPVIVPSEPTIIEYAPVEVADEPTQSPAAAIATIEATIAFGLEFMMKRHKLHGMLLDAQAAVAVLRAALAV